MKARFVARSANYSVGIQNLVKESYGTGESKVLKRRIDAQFQHHLVLDADLAVALSSLHFPGLPFDEDTNQNVSPRFRTSVWDSEFAKDAEGFTQKEVDLTIEKLRAKRGNSGEFVEVPFVAVAAPWPGYDEIQDANEIGKLVRATKIDPESVIAYESENQNRPEVFIALENAPVEDEAVVIEA